MDKDLRKLVIELTNKVDDLKRIYMKEKNFNKFKKKPNLKKRAFLTETEEPKKKSRSKKEKEKENNC